MKWYTYVLQSLQNRTYYIGSSSKTDERLTRHNKGLVRSTKRGTPWKIVYQEEYNTRQDAYRRERQIKSYKSGQAFKRLLKK